MKKEYFIFFIIIIFQISCTNKCLSFKTNPNKFYGIDVSQYQDANSKVDWSLISSNKNPKIDFAFIRSTMGVDGLDQSFKKNIQLAKKHNIKIGVYHYYRPNESAKEQFKNFLNNNDDIGDIPPAVDIEEKGNKGMRELRKEIFTFLQLIESHYGVKPIIYAYQKYYNLYFRNYFKDYDFWIARHHGIDNNLERNTLKDEPKLWNNTCPLIWQYSATGKVMGISTKVDLNVTNIPIWNQSFNNQ